MNVLASGAVVPVDVPESNMMIRKKTGKDRDMAASAVVDICPPKYVSTTLYIVLKKKPILAGRAIFRIRPCTGASVSSRDITG